MENTYTKTINYSIYDKFFQDDISERRLILNDEIDSNVIDSHVYHILRYNHDDKGIAVEDRKPILLYINSPGGSVVDGYGLIDAILLSETPVYTINVGQAASMGFLIYIAGHKRYAFPHSEFLMHDGETFGFGSVSKVKDRMEFETIQLEQMTKQYILDHTSIDSQTYDEKFRMEWYFLSEESKNIGVTDYIIGEDCKLSEIV